MAGASGDEIRVGLLGFGIAGAAFHAPLITATAGLRLDAVVTSDPERRAQVRRTYPGTDLVDSADDLLRRDGLGLVVVGTPNSTHVPLSLAALRAGYPVIVDKPMAPTAAAGRELVAEAERQGLLLTVFQNRRWDGDMLTLRGLLDAGSLGRVLRFESRFERWRPTPAPGWRSRSGGGEAGGLLYDLGAHLIDQALVLFGPADTVYAEVDNRRPGVEVDDDAFVALTHRSGVRSHLWMSAVAAQLGPRFRVLGDRAAYVKYGLDPQEAAMRAGGRPGSAGWGVEPPEQWGRLGVDGALTEVPTEPGAYLRFYDGVVAALRDGAPPPVDPRDAITGLEIIETAHRAAAQQRVLAVGPPE